MKYALVLLAVGCLVTAVNAQWLETTIELDSGSAPLALCYNPQNNKVYCANTDGDDVTVIDGATNQVTATLAAGDYPWVLCYNPTNNKVYCANSEGNSVTVIAGATDSVIATITTGAGPAALCYNPQNNKVYSANQWGFVYQAVTVIDGATNQVVANIAAGSSPVALCYNSQNNKVYCAVLYDRMVTVIDGATNQVIDTVAVGEEPGVLLYNSQNNKIYCGNDRSHDVTVIDGTTDSAVATLDVNLSNVLCYSPQNNVLYCLGSFGVLYSIDGRTDSIVDSLPWIPGDVHVFLYNPQGNKLYTAAAFANDYVSIVDCAENRVLLTIPVGDNPEALCHNPRQNRVYVANNASSTISVLRDSGGGIEESPGPPAPSHKLVATIIRSLPAGAVAFDAMGRRATRARAGVYFIATRGERSAVSVRKVVVQR